MQFKTIISLLVALLVATQASSFSTQGDVRLGTNNVIHPSAQLIARNGPIVMTSGNVLEADVRIENNSGRTMEIGSGNVFKRGSRSESPKLGSGNVLKTGAHVGPNVEMTSGCVIGTNCDLSTSMRMTSGTVVKDC